MLGLALLVWLLVMSVITYVAYARDKAAARRGARRTRERTLWALDLAGGFVGGWIGMLHLRHKTRHATFWFVQIVSTAIWLAGILFLIVAGLLP